MTPKLIVSTVVFCGMGLSLLSPAWAQSPVVGAVNRAAEHYKRCMLAPVAEYAQRIGTPENLAEQITRLCADEKAALSAAYVSEFFPPSAIGKPKDMAKTYVDQIAAANREIVRLDITRLRIEAKQRPM